MAIERSGSVGAAAGNLVAPQNEHVTTQAPTEAPSAAPSFGTREAQQVVAGAGSPSQQLLVAALDSRSARSAKRQERQEVRTLLYRLNALDTQIDKLTATKVTVDAEAGKKQQEIEATIAAEKQKQRSQQNARAVGSVAILLLGAAAGADAEVHGRSSAGTWDATDQALRDYNRAKDRQAMIRSQDRTADRKVGAASNEQQALMLRSTQLETQIAGLAAERDAKHAELEALRASYRDSVNEIFSEVPGFTKTLGAVEDIKLVADPKGAASLIDALTFKMNGKLVTVRVADLEQFVADGFAGLVASRRANEAKLDKRLTEAQQRKGELGRLITAVDAEHGPKIRALEGELEANNGLFHPGKERDIQARLTRAKAARDGAKSPLIAEQQKLDGELAHLPAEAKEAKSLSERAATAQKLLSHIDRGAAKRALQEVGDLL